jgi:hypothetical protein
MSNCFQMRCPGCGDTDHIDIEALVSVRLTDDGTDADISANGDHYWDQDSHASCVACGFSGSVRQFEDAGEAGAT